jgi:NodT family efflux transporter outer membrane factor (OMF) lipoprotein
MPAKPYCYGALTFATVLAVSGCAVGPDFKKPTAPAGAGYTAEPLPQTTAAAPVIGGDAQRLVEGQDVAFKWWESFGSPDLNALVEQAFRNNPTIPAAQAALRQAQELLKAQYGYFFPSIGANYTYERQKVEGNTATSSAPGVQGNGQNLVPNGPAQPLFYNFSTAQLTVGFTPDVFGANRRKVESLDAQAQIQRFQLEATYVTLASNVVAAAIQEASTRAQVEATQKVIDYNQKTLQILQDKFRQGYAMNLDVALIEAQLAQAEATLPPLNKQLEQTRDLLHALVGEMPNGKLDQTFTLASLKLPQDLPLSLPSKLIEQRPDVRAAEEQMRSQNAQVGVAVAAMLPQFNIAGSIGGGANEFDNMFSPGGPFWTLIGGVTQPVFEGGTLLHTRRAADQALLQAAAQYQSTVITAYQNVADTLHAVVEDATALQADALAERAARKAADVAQDQLKEGYTDLATALAAEITYQQAVLSLVQAQSTRYGDTVALYQSLGGGWWNRKADDTTTAATSAPHGDTVASR